MPRLLPTSTSESHRWRVTKRSINRAPVSGVAAVLVRLLDLFLGDREAVALAGLDGQSPLPAFHDFANDGQFKVAVPQTVAHLPGQAFQGLVKHRFVIRRYHLVHCPRATGCGSEP